MEYYLFIYLFLISPIKAFELKIFKRNNINVNYSCTSNICQIIKGHIKEIEITHSNIPNKQCNSRDKETCPLLGNCLQKSVVYRTTVKTNNPFKQYIGSTEGTIKQGIYDHKLSFTNRNYSTNTFLSIHFWHLKDKYITHHHLGYTKTSTCLQQDIKKCLLCLHKKLAIITHPSQNTLLNKQKWEKTTTKNKTKTKQKFYPNADMIATSTLTTHNPPT